MFPDSGAPSAAVPPANLVGYIPRAGPPIPVNYNFAGSGGLGGQVFMRDAENKADDGSPAVGRSRGAALEGKFRREGAAEEDDYDDNVDREASDVSKVRFRFSIFSFLR